MLFMKHFSSSSAGRCPLVVIDSCLVHTEIGVPFNELMVSNGANKLVLLEVSAVMF